jgi:hypothetical protein
MNRLQTLLAKGINSEVAHKIVELDIDLSELSSFPIEKLENLGIKAEIKQKLFSNRPPIPSHILDSLLHKSRRTCCICREVNRSIIVHHIIEWNISRSNEEDNLVVLCLQHHDEAHSKKELSQNLTPARIKAAKKSWENEVLRLDKEIFISDFRELEATTVKLFNLKKQWFYFLRSIGMNIEIVTEPTSRLKFDFRIRAKNNLLVKVFEIDSIEELINRDKLVQNFKDDAILDELIILGNKPFLSNGGFYADELNIQIGWIYSFGEMDWDNLMLKEKFDISNSKFFIINLLYENTNYRCFLTDKEYKDVMRLWKIAMR